MKITLGGLGGTGTSTVGKMLAKEFGWNFVSGGNMFREAAAENNMTMEEFDAYTKANLEYRVDEVIDDKLKKYGEEHEHFILESKLGWWQVPDSFKILFVADLDERARRIMKGDTEGNRNAYTPHDFETTKQKTIDRNEVHRLRIKAIYGIENLFSGEHFDYIINTAQKSQEEVFEELASVIKGYHSEKIVNMKIAAGVLLKDRKLLLVSSKGTYAEPGGKIEPEETAVQGLIRELTEEISLKIHVDDVETLSVDYAEAAADPGFFMRMTTFVVKQWEEDTLQKNNEIKDLVWITSKEVEEYNISSVFKTKIIPMLIEMDLMD